MLPLASAASLCDNSLCRLASQPNYFSGLHSVNKSHGLRPSRILLNYRGLPFVVIFVLPCPPAGGWKTTLLKRDIITLLPQHERTRCSRQIDGARLCGCQPMDSGRRPQYPPKSVERVMLGFTALRASARDYLRLRWAESVRNPRWNTPETGCE